MGGDIVGEGVPALCSVHGTGVRGGMVSCRGLLDSKLAFVWGVLIGLAWGVFLMIYTVY